MKLWQRIKNWWNNEIEKDITLIDEICHDPKYHKNPKPELKETNNGFIEIPNQQEYIIKCVNIILESKK